MKKLKELFLNTDMNLRNTLLFSLAVGIFCGIFGGLPALKDTSFTDMAGGYEFWVFTAVFICINSKDFKTAGIHCGLYFLISQAVQFFLQALLYSHNFSNALYYLKTWMPVIIMTIPGGMAAYFSKKDSWLGATILGLGNAIEAVSFVVYLRLFINNPPAHLLSTVFSIVSIFVMTLWLQKKRMNRMIAFGIPCLLCAVVVIYAKLNGLTI